MAWGVSAYLPLLGGLLFGLPSSAKARNEPYSQTPVRDPSLIVPARPEAIPDSNAYNRRALRFESQLGTIKIIEGADGAIVGRTEWFKRFDLASLVRSSERAVAEASGFNRNRRAGEWGFALGFVVFAVDAIILKVTGDPNAASVITALGATALMVYGAERLGKANEALSKSLWWYNQDLTK